MGVPSKMRLGGKPFIVKGPRNKSELHQVRVATSPTMGTSKTPSHVIATIVDGKITKVKPEITQ